MAYGRFSNPTFYIDVGLLASTIGAINVNESAGNLEGAHFRLYYLNPSAWLDLVIPPGGTANAEIFQLTFGETTLEGSKYVPSLDWFAFLGIGLDGNNTEVEFGIDSYTWDGTTHTSRGTLNMNTLNELFGANAVTQTTASPGNGYMFGTFTNPWQNDVEIHCNQIRCRIFSQNGENFRLGSLCLGWSWTPSFSPDMGVIEEYTMDGVSKIKTIGGKDFTKINYVGSPKWIGNGLRPFQRSKLINSLGDGENATYLNFRKKWQMSFSYVADTKLKPDYNFDYANWTGGAPFIFVPTDPTGTQDSTGFYNGINDDFISKVWYGTMGGNLPFIFRPDSSVEEFHIVKFVDNSISFEEIAHNTHSISFELEEVW